MFEVKEYMLLCGVAAREVRNELGRDRSIA